MIEAQPIQPLLPISALSRIAAAVLHVLKYGALTLLVVFPLAFGGDTVRLNPAQQASLGNQYSLVGWEISNFFDKWAHRVSSAVPWNSVDRNAAALDYFRLQQDINGSIDERNRAVAVGDTDVASDLAINISSLTQERDGLRNDAEEAIEAAISAAFNETGLRGWFGFVFPPVDIRLTDTPHLLITSPRAAIAREHEALLTSDIDLDDRIVMEDTLEASGDRSAITLQIGGLAAYPAPIIGSSLRGTLHTAAHEWVHHYMFFKPLGQAMFSSGEMVSLNETVADIIGRELGDRAYEIITGEPIHPPQPQAASQPVDEDRQPSETFDFNVEMRETRLHVDELLAAGQVEEAEAYMEQRRLFFVDNGHYIRKLNQAYFAFNGTYAENPTSSSPIGGQLTQLREQSADLGVFISTAAGVSSYLEFLSLLEKQSGGAGG